MAQAEPKTVITTAKSKSMFEVPTKLRPIDEYKLSGFESFWYYLSVFVTLGYWYTVKVAYKKALSEKWSNQ